MAKTPQMPKLKRQNILVIVVGILVIGTVFITRIRLQSNRNPSSLLGIALPASVTNVQIDIQPRFIDEFDAYLRFDIAPQDLPQLLADPSFQPTQITINPMTVFWNAARGGTPMGQIVAAARPAWWQPEQSMGCGNINQYTTVYRTRLGPGYAYSGPDSAWYIIDKSDPKVYPKVYTVYVFASEV
jgi:hypothetical protein